MTAKTAPPDEHVEALLGALDDAADESAVERAESLLGRLVARRAAKTRERLDREANAARLMELQGLRAEIVAAAGDANTIAGSLHAAVEAVATLMEAVSARQERHNRWRQELRRLDVAQNCVERDAGLGCSEYGKTISVGRVQIGFLDVPSALAALLELAGERAGCKERSPAGKPSAAVCTDPAGYIRQVMGSDAGTAK